MSKGLVQIGYAIVRNKDGKFFAGWDSGMGYSSGEAIWDKKPTVVDVVQLAKKLDELKCYGELTAHPMYVDFGD